MDKNLQRLQVAQDLVASLIMLIPPGAHAAAQAALDAASARLKGIDAQTIPQPSPLVVPQLVPAVSA